MIYRFLSCIQINNYFLSILWRWWWWRIGSIVLNIGCDKWYIIRYIILDGLSKRYKNLILAHIFDISSDISLSYMKIVHLIRSRCPIFRNLVGIPFLIFFFFFNLCLEVATVWNYILWAEKIRGWGWILHRKMGSFCAK